MKRTFIPGIILLLFIFTQVQGQNILIQAADLAAEANFEASNQMLDEFIEHNPTRLYDLADAWFLKSYNAMQLGDYATALHDNEISADLKTKLYVEDIAINFMREGTIHLLNGDSERALNTLMAATEFPIEDPQTYALIYAYISSAYQEMGNYPKALEKLIESLEILEFELGTDHPDYATGSYDLGRLYTKMGQTELAEQTFSSALEISQDLESGTAIRAKILNAWGVLYQEADPPKGIGLFQQALAEYEKLPGSLNPEAALTHLNLAKTWINKFISDKQNLAPNESMAPAIPSLAEVHIEHAQAKITTTEGNIINYQILAESKALLALDYMIVKEGRVDLLRAGLAYCLDAVDHLYQHLELLSSDGAKFKLLEESHFIFETGIRTGMMLFEKTGETLYAWNALSICEKSKAIVLNTHLDMLQVEDEEVTSLKRAIRQAEARLLFDSDNTGLHKTLEQKRKALISYFMDRPRASKFRTTAFPALETLQSEIHENTAWLTYFIGQSEYYIFALNKDAFQAEVLPLNFSYSKAKKSSGMLGNLDISGKSTPGVYTQLKDKQKNIPLNQSAGGMLSAIKKMDKRLYVLYAHDLYTKLIQPVQPILKGKHHLLVSPDKELFKVPFEAFLSRPVDEDSKIKFHKLKYLVNDHAIEYVYSFNSPRPKLQEKASGSKFSFLGVAPVFDPNGEGIMVHSDSEFRFDSTFQNDANIRASISENNAFAPLTNSSEEIMQISTLFQSKGQNVQLLLKENATEQAFKKQSSDFDIIHLATHSFPHSKNGKLSGIALFQPTIAMKLASREDGILYAAEIPALELNAGLVVLSSCESSVGPILKGDGPYSLARTFREAGAQKVISSLWKLYDSYSKEMMVVFYKNLLAEDELSNALREAKIKMIKNKKSANPGIWSSLILIQ